MFQVLVKRLEDDKVVRRIKAGDTEWQAAHTKIGIEEKLDHDKYYTVTQKKIDGKKSEQTD